jgi:DALR anticodon binding domain
VTRTPTNILLPSLRGLIGHRIQKILHLVSKEGIVHESRSLNLVDQKREKRQEWTIPNTNFEYIPLALPLTRVKYTTNIEYVSAIALQLTNHWQIPTLDLAEAIAFHLTSTIKTSYQSSYHLLGQESSLNEKFDTHDVWQILQPHTSVFVEPSGMIHWQLQPLGVAAWLQFLTKFIWSFQSIISTFLDDRNTINDYDNSSLQKVKDTKQLFFFQHTHARCYSLLKLAEREDLIKLNSYHLDHSLIAKGHAVWITQPDPIPWINQSDILHFTLAAEVDLLIELLDTLDTLAKEDLKLAREQKESFLLKLSFNLSQAFQHFYAACRIVGEVKIIEPERAQARLGLVFLTQYLLRLLLQDLLKIDAPNEL